MNLRIKIEEKYKNALKSKKVDETNAIRLIKSAIKDKDIENRTKNTSGKIDDQQILTLLQGLIKQRKDSIEFFKEASRNDLIDKETNEIKIINQFLPKLLSTDETKKIIEKFIYDNNITSIIGMGKIMNFLKTNLAGSIDMSIAGKIAKKLLGY